MIPEKIEEALNNQINAELNAAYIYQAMGAYFEANNMEGFASWMDKQAEEEVGHARKIYDFINERGGRVALKGIDAPPVEWDSPLEVFEDALEHEKKVTAMINELVDLAESENDRAAVSFLQWFIDEQVEEEDSVESIIDKLEMVGGSSNGLYMLDKELGQR